VVLSYDKIVAQLDCSTPEDGTKVVLEQLPKVTAWCRSTSSPWSSRCIDGHNQSRSIRPLTPSCLAQWTQQ